MAEPALLGARRARRAKAEGVPDDELHWFIDVREETDVIGRPLRADTCSTTASRSRHRWAR